MPSNRPAAAADVRRATAGGRRVTDGRRASYGGATPAATPAGRRDRARHDGAAPTLERTQGIARAIGTTPTPAAGGLPTSTLQHRTTKPTAAKRGLPPVLPWGTAERIERTNGCIAACTRGRHDASVATANFRPAAVAAGRRSGYLRKVIAQPSRTARAYGPERPQQRRERGELTALTRSPTLSGASLPSVGVHPTLRSHSSWTASANLASTYIRLHPTNSASFSPCRRTRLQPKEPRPSIMTDRPERRMVLQRCPLVLLAPQDHCAHMRRLVSFPTASSPHRSPASARHN